MNESSFWRKIRKGLQDPPNTHLTRIENIVYSGVPDISFCINEVKGTASIINASEGFIELKYLQNWPERAATIVRVPHFKHEQRIWLHDRSIAGGRCFVCLGIGRSTFLIDGLQAAMFLGKDWRKIDIYDNSIAYWDKPQVDWDIFKSHLVK